MSKNSKNRKRKRLTTTDDDDKAKLPQSVVGAALDDDGKQDGGVATGHVQELSKDFSGKRKRKKKKRKKERTSASKSCSAEPSPTGAAQKIKDEAAGPVEVKSEVNWTRAYNRIACIEVDRTALITVRIGQITCQMDNRGY